eukprot:SAG11_NODE_1288_length_5297_cov_13.005194_7_plen_64_part_00
MGNFFQVSTVGFTIGWNFFQVSTVGFTVSGQLYGIWAIPYRATPYRYSELDRSRKTYSRILGT